MNTITLVEHITLPDNTRVIEITISYRGVRVVLEDLHGPGYDTSIDTLQWSEISDVESLADLFDTEAVRTFKVLIEMLGKIHSNKHIYDALT